MNIEITPINDGEVLLVNKPLTWTSTDVVRKLKGILKVKKIGHAGTLDPLATGLLIICTGKKTKTIPFIQDEEKEYTGTFYLGATTPSFDKETEHDSTFDVSGITNEQIMEAVDKLKGHQLQTPPMFSAVKVNGKRAYAMARKGETVELKSKPIEIKEFEISRIELPEIDFRIVCTKGTYIRSIARDLGGLLNNGAYLIKLVRTRIGQHMLTEASEIESFKAIANDQTKQQ
jgi:tRNA pseudouridine55 synthase